MFIYVWQVEQPHNSLPQLQTLGYYFQGSIFPFSPTGHRTCLACNPHVLSEIHKFSNLNFMNIPKINRSTGPHYITKLSGPGNPPVQTGGPAVKSISVSFFFFFFFLRGGGGGEGHCSLIACEIQSIMPYSYLKIEE